MDGDMAARQIARERMLREPLKMRASIRPLLLSSLVACAAIAAGCSDDDTIVYSSTTVAGDDTPEAALDPTFGAGGRFVLEDALGSDGAAVATAVIDQSTRIYVAGSTVDGQGVRSLAVWRFHDTGFPDVSFGTNGAFVLTTTASPLVASGSAAACIATTPDGTAFVGGAGIAAGGERDAIVIEVAPNGALRQSWVNAGSATAVPVGRVDLGLGRDEVAAAIAIGAGDRVHLAGSSREAGAAPGPGFDAAPGAAFVARFQYVSGNSGPRQLAPFYGDFLTTPGIAASAQPSDRAFAMVLEGGTDAILAGTRGGGLALFRFDNDGIPKTTTGTAAVVTLGGSTSVSERGTAIAIREDGSLAVAGVRATSASGATTTAIIAWRFDAAARLVGGFGDGGRTVIQVADGETSATGVAIDLEGRILVSGEGRGSFPAAFAEDPQGLLLRLTTDGRLDDDFTPSGIFLLDAPLAGRRTRAAAIVLSDPVPLGFTAVLGGTEVIDGDGDGGDASIWRVVLPGTFSPR